MDQNSDRKDIAPLALLVHPQQPLSYLERLIQSELPSINNENGDNRIPKVSFRAMEAPDDKIKPKKSTADDDMDEDLGSSSKDTLGDGSVESYSGAGREGRGQDTGEFVRWSSSTEIGDFIRDAARAKEFEVEIEGHPDPIKVGVPSFNDRTFYLRQRLRKVSKEISEMAALKEECDRIAHRGGQRLAMGGCAILVAYWYTVYRLTFETELGWDTMEPVTYLVGLSTFIGGYMWFLYHNREVSYRSALNLTISRRQSKLYEARGFNLPRWEGLVEDGNAIRKEIKAVAAEYDVEWDERADEHDEAVTRALRKERKNVKDDKSKGNDDDGDDD
jgi:calcium uniporter protein, mitochondrial